MATTRETRSLRKPVQGTPFHAGGSRLFGVEEVEGSIPSSSTININPIFRFISHVPR